MNNVNGTQGTHSSIKTTPNSETSTNSASELKPLHSSDQGQISVKKRIQEFTKNFAPLNENLKPPAPENHKSEPTLLLENVRRPGRKSMVQTSVSCEGERDNMDSENENVSSIKIGGNDVMGGRFDQ